MSPREEAVQEETGALRTIFATFLSFENDSKIKSFLQTNQQQTKNAPRFHNLKCFSKELRVSQIPWISGWGYIKLNKYSCSRTSD